jgi:DNA-binding NarL/FixJ family response regulator
VSDGPSVLLVEDHLAVRKGLELLLRDRGFHVMGATASADEGLRMFIDRHPDVAIVDVDLGTASGLDLVERMLEHRPGAGVLVYTGLSDPSALHAAASCGARGFVLKTIAPSDLMAAARAVAAGGLYVDPCVAELLAPRAARAALLSRREREVLDLLALGMTGQQVASELFLSPETVRTHVRNAMKKLGASTRVHAVAMAVRLREITL